MHGGAAIHDAAQVELRGQFGVRAVDSREPLLLRRQRRVQLQEIAHRGDEPGVVPRLGQVVRGAGLHQLDRGFQVGPRREQHHRQVGLRGAQCAEQRDALVAGGRLALEVHVLDDEVDAAAGHPLEARLRRCRTLDTGAFEREQDVERRAHGLVVVDDEQCPTLHAPSCVVPRRCLQTVRVAMAGETSEARRAGCNAATRLTIHRTTTPATR
jgi:hypothetical protein